VGIRGTSTKESQVAERKKSTKQNEEVAVDLPEESTPLVVPAVEVTPDSIDLSVPEVSISVSATTDGDEMYTRRHSGVSSTPEPSALLTDERLLDIKEKLAAPEGLWQGFIYAITFHTVNLGDSRKARARKAMEARIATALSGDARFVPVLTRKGGVGKTTTTTLLGQALARVREDRVIAIDANPDRGTLVERIQRSTRHTIRTVVQKAPSIGSFTDFSEYVSRDQTRLDVLASDADPMLSQAFDEFDYNIVADIASRYYSIILTDCGTGIVHSVMKPILQRADGLVIVSGGSIDEARLASETLTWLESNGYAELVAKSVVALNTATQGTVLVKLDEIENHFKSRVRDVVRIPYDSHIAAGSVITWDKLSKLTRESASLLAALVVEGLPTTK
jgi:MinD-like ATPase involved in chromosome partitioning or flagellar assembly